MDTKVLIGGAVAAGVLFFVVKKSKATITVVKKDGSVTRVEVPSGAIPGASTFSGGTVKTAAPEGESLPGPSASLAPFSQSASDEDVPAPTPPLAPSFTTLPAGGVQVLYASQAAHARAQMPGTPISFRPTSIAPGGSSSAQSVAGLFNIRRHEGRKGRRYQTQRGAPSGLVQGW